MDCINKVVSDNGVTKKGEVTDRTRLQILRYSRN